MKKKVYYGDCTRTGKRLDITKRNEWKQKFATKLKELMASRGMDEIKLAQLSDLTQASISNYVIGKHVPTAYNMYKLSKALCVSTDELMDL